VIDPEALARDAAAFVAVPSETGDERAALERLGEMAGALGLPAELYEHDLAALRAHPAYPGEEAPRSSLWGLTVTSPSPPTRGAGRLAVCGHVDVVPAGTVAWRHARAQVDQGMAARIALAVPRPAPADGDLQLDHRLEPVDVGTFEQAGLDQAHGPGRIASARGLDCAT